MQLQKLEEALPLEVWRGAVRAWQCDEMGHQNSSFYITQADEGLSGIVAALGSGATEALSSFRPTGHHVRFLHELSAGTPIFMRGGIVALGADHIRVAQALFNSESRKPCATILTDLRGDARSGGLNESLQRTGQELLVNVPIKEFVQGVPERIHGPAVDFSTAQALGMTQTALGGFRTEEAGPDRTAVASDVMIRRLGDATRYLSRLFERTAHAHDAARPRLGSAALECRLDYFGWPNVGDRFLVRSGYSNIGVKSRRVVHWMFDADSKQPLCALHSLEVNFDLDARRARPVGPEVAALLEHHLVAVLCP